MKNSVMTGNKYLVNKVMDSIRITFLGGKFDLFKARIQLANFSNEDILNNAAVVLSEYHI